MLSFCPQFLCQGRPLADPEIRSLFRKPTEVNLWGRRTECRECGVDMEGQVANAQRPILGAQTARTPKASDTKCWLRQYVTALHTLTSPQRTRSERAKWDIMQFWATLQAPPLAVSLFAGLPSEENQARKRTGPPHPPRHLQPCQYLGIFSMI